MSASSEDKGAFLEAYLKKEKSGRTLTLSATLNSRDFGGGGVLSRPVCPFNRKRELQI